MVSDLLKSEIKLSTIFVTLCCLVFSACSSDNNSQSHNPNSRYNQGSYQQPQQYSRPPQPRYDSYYQNRQPQPSYGNPYGQQGGSAYYSNPYAFPAQNNYPYYDGDQYYVPPTSYGSNGNGGPPQSFDQKM